MIRKLSLALVALLGLSGIASAQTFTLPELGLQSTGACRQLAVRDRSNGAMVPLGCLNVSTHQFSLTGVVLPAAAASIKGNLAGTAGTASDIPLATLAAPGNPLGDAIAAAASSGGGSGSQQSAAYSLKGNNTAASAATTDVLLSALPFANRQQYAETLPETQIGQAGFPAGAIDLTPGVGFQLGKIWIADKRGKTAGGAHHTLTLSKVAEGSGRFGPGNNDTTLFTYLGKKDWLTTGQDGELDGIQSFTFQGAKGDTGGLIIDVTKKRQNLGSYLTTNFTYSQGNGNLTAGQTSFAVPGGYTPFAPQLGVYYCKVFRNGTEIATSLITQDDGVNVVLKSGAPTILASDTIRIERTDESGGGGAIEGNVSVVRAIDDPQNAGQKIAFPYHRAHMFMGFMESPQGLSGGKGYCFLAETRGGAWFSAYHAGSTGSAFTDETGVALPNSFDYAFTNALTRDPTTLNYAVAASTGRVNNGTLVGTQKFVNYGYDAALDAFTVLGNGTDNLFTVGRLSGVATAKSGIQIGGGQVLTFLRAGTLPLQTFPSTAAYASFDLTTVNVPGAAIGDWVAVTISSIATQYNAFRVWGVVTAANTLTIRVQNVTNAATADTGATVNMRWEVKRYQ